MDELSKDAEIVVLRHQLAVLRRQRSRPRFSWADRALVALLSRLVPRERWQGFLIRPGTVLGWHRCLVRKHWTYPRRRPGRPALPDETVSSLQVGEGKHSLGLPAHRGRAEEAGRAGLQGERGRGAAPPPPPAVAAEARPGAPARLTPADLEALQFPGATVYICGSSPFADAATDATRALGIPDGRVRVERFGQTG